MMWIRPYKPHDYMEVCSLYERTFPFPDLSDTHYVVRQVAVIDSKIVALGLVRLTSEALVILDESQRKRVKVEALTRLITVGSEECKLINVDEMHVFVTGDEEESWAGILERKFGFVKCKGIVLTKLLGE